jgi:hypothetical protein
VLGAVPEHLGVDEEPVHVEERGAQGHPQTLAHPDVP